MDNLELIEDIEQEEFSENADVSKVLEALDQPL